MSGQETPDAVDAPVLRVVRGSPTPARLAALTAVLVGLSGDGDRSGQRGSGSRPRTLWTARSRFARPRPAVGPGGWRASSLPR
ncbi:hypothetical protein BJF80_10430 [Serinicoccus sp. CUA-874]|uniref:acyl-CoA carboxylase subunit epsilon n=1 Tax=Serinicoccus sp. CUA-874 TaxID=1517939 RepID=UPI0009650877|nr:acyl-CoA carboxylase subunit epsilon [Serinicoccus sp. CUA-874]OLT15278.1 hypothetical protein BJF80_10430 [Serinicoccus sp. CUA-874]